MIVFRNTVTWHAFKTTDFYNVPDYLANKNKLYLSAFLVITVRVSPLIEKRQSI